MNKILSGVRIICAKEREREIWKKAMAVSWEIDEALALVVLAAKFDKTRSFRMIVCDTILFGLFNLRLNVVLFASMHAIALNVRVGESEGHSIHSIIPLNSSALVLFWSPRPCVKCNTRASSTNNVSVSIFRIDIDWSLITIHLPNRQNGYVIHTTCWTATVTVVVASSAVQIARWWWHYGCVFNKITTIIVRLAMPISTEWRIAAHKSGEFLLFDRRTGHSFNSNNNNKKNISLVSIIMFI